MSDLTIARNGVVKHLLSGEKLWADAIYKDDNYFLTPVSPSQVCHLEDILWNSAHSVLRFQRIERVFGRQSKWGLCRTRWRGDHRLHYIFINVLAQIYNIELECGAKMLKRENV